MQIKDMFTSNFDEFDNKLSDLYDAYEKRLSDITRNFKENTVEQVDNIISSKDLKDFKKNLNDHFLDNIDKYTKIIKESTISNIELITNKTKELILFNLNNPLYDIRLCSKVLDEYKKNVTEMTIINQIFIKRFDNDFDFLLYYISVDLNLKNDVSSYKLIINILKQNKKILLDNFKDLINENKKEVCILFSNYLENFIDDALELKENIIMKNNSILMDYVKDSLQENVNITVCDDLKRLCKDIEKELNDCHKDILKLQKSKKTNEKEVQLNVLKNELINFNNTLFDKSLKLLLKTITIVEYDKKEIEKKVDEFNHSIYKICEFEYNFDRQFMNYEKEMQNKKYFISSKINDQIDKRISEAKIRVIDMIKNAVIALFKDNVSYLNVMIYKNMMTKYKLKNYSDFINKKDVVAMFA